MNTHNFLIEPQNPTLGMFYFNVNRDTFMGWDGTQWIDLGYDQEIAETWSKQMRRELDIEER